MRCLLTDAATLHRLHAACRDLQPSSGPRPVVHDLLARSAHRVVWAVNAGFFILFISTYASMGLLWTNGTPGSLEAGAGLTAWTWLLLSLFLLASGRHSLHTGPPVPEVLVLHPLPPEILSWRALRYIRRRTLLAGLMTAAIVCGVVAHFGWAASKQGLPWDWRLAPASALALGLMLAGLAACAHALLRAVRRLPEKFRLPGVAAVIFLIAVPTFFPLLLLSPAAAPWVHSFGLTRQAPICRPPACCCGPHSHPPVPHGRRC